MCLAVTASCAWQQLNNVQTRITAVYQLWKSNMLQAAAESHVCNNALLQPNAGDWRDHHNQLVIRQHGTYQQQTITHCQRESGAFMLSSHFAWVANYAHTAGMSSSTARCQRPKPQVMSIAACTLALFVRKPAIHDAQLGNRTTGMPCNHDGY